MSLPSSDPFSALALPAQGSVWRADELGRADVPTLPTGHAALDVQLPGGGWPVGALTEILQARPEASVWPLLLPALARAVARHPHARAPVVLIGALHEPFGPALAAAGVPVQALLWVRAQGVAERLWACEQALRCADVAAVLAWLPQARVAELRRLQLAAARHEGLLFVFRPEAAAHGASPARLRLRVATSVEAAEAGQMEVHLLKRRGPPLADPVTLPARSAGLAALLAAAHLRRQGHAAAVSEAKQPGATVVHLAARRASRASRAPHAMGRNDPGGTHALAGPAVAA